MPKVPYKDLPLAEILNNCNGLDYFLSKKFQIKFCLTVGVIVEFLQQLDAVGYANFYLNAEVRS